MWNSSIQISRYLLSTQPNNHDPKPNQRRGHKAEWLEEHYSRIRIPESNLPAWESQILKDTLILAFPFLLPPHRKSKLGIAREIYTTFL
jgi:hypothetical protein